MNSTGYQTISSTASLVDTEKTAADKETANGANSDRASIYDVSPLPPIYITGLQSPASRAADSELSQRKSTKARSLSPGDDRPRDFLTGLEYRTKFMREIWSEKNTVWTKQSRKSFCVAVNRQAKSASRAREYSSRGRSERRRAGTRSIDERPREFLTGVDYRTKFMRPLPYDAAQKSRINNSVDMRSQQTRMDTRTANQWRQNKSSWSSLLRFPIRKADVKKSTYGNQNLPKAFSNRGTPPFTESTAALRIAHVVGYSAANVKGCTKINTSFRSLKNPETMKLGEKQMRQRLAKFRAAMTAEVGSIQSEGAPENKEMIVASRLSQTLDQTTHSFDRSVTDNFIYGFSKADLSINIPNSPTSEPGGSNSLHTTPRSPRMGQKKQLNALLHTACSETLSHQSEHSLPPSETLETKMASSPPARVSCSLKPYSLSKKHKFFLSSNSSLTCKPRESFAKEHRNKTPATKQKPVTFTSQFAPLLRWANKANPGGFFEPRCREGSNIRPNSSNSTENKDGDNALKAATSEAEQLNQQSEETSTSNADVHNEPHVQLRSTTQDETALSKESETSHTGHQMAPVRKTWKLTRPQQILSRCALWSATPSPLLRQHQSVKNIAMAKQPAAYTRTAKWPVGDFARRPISAAVNKRPVWK